MNAATRDGPRPGRDPVGHRRAGRGRHPAARRPGRPRRAQPQAAAAALRRGDAGRSGRGPCASAACCSRVAGCGPCPAATYELVAGRAAAGAPPSSRDSTSVPALVRPADDAQALEVALIENWRARASTRSRRRAGARPLVEELGLTREEVGARIGRSRVAVSNLLRPARPARRGAGPDRGRRAQSEGHGRRSSAAGRRQQRPTAAWRVTAAAHGWSVRVLEDKARMANDAGAERAPPRTAHARAAPRPGRRAIGRRISDAMSAALGTEVRVRPSGTGYTRGGRPRLGGRRAGPRAPPAPARRRLTKQLKFSAGPPLSWPSTPGD